MFNFEDYNFFNPSPNFREMLILQLISNNSEISQETLAKKVGIVPSMINRYLKDFEEKSFIIKTGETRRKMNYEITETGEKRLQFLMVSYINEVSNIYSQTKKSFEKVFNLIEHNNFKNIILYGAGVVGGIVLKLLMSENLNVVGFTDDSPSKTGEKLHGFTIFEPEEVSKLNYDAVIAASFKHSSEIAEKAREHNLKNIYVFKIDETGTVSISKEW